MSVEIRPVTTEELPAFLDVATYVFADNRPREEITEAEAMQAEWTLAAFVDDRIAASYAAYPFRIRLNGAPVDVAGVTAVGTYPEYRRRGLLRSLITRAISDERDRGQAFAMLWASFGAIYQRFGYGLASQWHGYEVEPRNIAFNPASTPAEGHVRLVQKEEARPILERVHREYIDPRNLAIVRAKPLWDNRLRRKDLHVGVYYDANDEPRGYLTFTTQETDEHDRPWGPLRVEPAPDQWMWILESVALDADARRGLWEFVAAHDLVDRARWENVPADDAAPFFLLEPRDLRGVIGDGIWLRVNDAEAALEARPYGDDGALTIRVVEDDLADWNNGTYRLEAAGEERRVQRTEGSPDVTLRPAQLAVLLSGSASASRLARGGLIEVTDDDARIRADRMFRTEYAPWCGDGF